MIQVYGFGGAPEETFTCGVPALRRALPERFSLRHALMLLAAATILSAYFVAMARSLSQ